MANEKNLQKETALATKREKQQLTVSERFTNKVIEEFTGGVGEIQLSDFQRRLAQNYFMAVDIALKTAEVNRQRKRKNKDPLPVTWENIDMQELARDVVTYARIGLDPSQKNHINPPYKNNAKNKYDIGFIEGYRGIELKAVKYGLDVPDAVIVELVHKNDTFKVIKKDMNNKYESYEFEVVNPFDRGEIIGGFYYHAYKDNPEKNKIVTFTLADIEKRKPQYASVEFWGGEKTVWEDGKPAGKEKVEGWYEKMCWKTIYRAAYSDITIDSQKIDDDYLRAKQMDMKMAEARVEAEIDENANQEIIDIEGEIVDDTGPDIEVEHEEPHPEPAKDIDGQVTLDAGPGY